MDKLEKLFYDCVYSVKYSQAGDSVNYAFIEDNDRLKIFFEGSNSITDWVRNMLFSKRPYKDMLIPYRVHRGFLAAWREVKDIILRKITQLDSNESFKWKKITIIGFSHGAALAGFCHEFVWYHRADLRDNGLEGYGFEAPRFFAGFIVPDVLKERWKTFVVIRTNNDIVTFAPPWVLGYTHVGSLLKIKGDHTLVKNKQPKCIKSHYPQVVLDALRNHKLWLLRYKAYNNRYK